MRGPYTFDVTCQGTVPQALRCYLEAESFEDTIRNAISMGGDSDTLAAIAGALPKRHLVFPTILPNKQQRGSMSHCVRSGSIQRSIHETRNVRP